LADSDAKTTVLVQLVERMRGGDRAACEVLIRTFQSRLEHLARKMLHRYPRVGRWVEVEDVLQASLLRLLRALESVQPTSTRAFFGLAAEQIRRELLDLSRHLYGPQGEGANFASVGNDPDDSRPRVESPNENYDSDLEQWSAFHQEVAKLAPREREIVGLIYYHGWTQAQVAELFNVSARTVRRWWEAALVDLHRALKSTDDENSES
jgi:RNA polymerase sigma factor (sigma-70 family)